MNFFDSCKLLLENGVYYAEICGVRFLLDDFQQEALKQNGQQPCDIICGIRPQHITVGQGELSAQVNVSEMLGSEIHLHATVADNEVVMVVPTVELSAQPKTGDVIRFTIQPDLIQLFDKASENNLIWYDKESSEQSAPVCKTYDF